MATSSDKEQKGIDVRYHARLAMGVKLDGTSMQPKGGNEESKAKSGGLSHASKKNK